MLLSDTKCFATVTSTMETRLLSISKASPTYRMHVHHKMHRHGVSVGGPGRLFTHRWLSVYMNICFQFDFDAVVDPNLHQKRSEKGKGKQGQRRQRKPSVASLAKEPASRKASDSHLRGRVTQAHRLACARVPTGGPNIDRVFVSKAGEPNHVTPSEPRRAQPQARPTRRAAAQAAAGRGPAAGLTYRPLHNHLLKSPYTSQAPS